MKEQKEEFEPGDLIAETLCDSHYLILLTWVDNKKELGRGYVIDEFDWYEDRKGQTRFYYKVGKPLDDENIEFHNCMIVVKGLNPPCEG